MTKPRSIVFIAIILCLLFLVNNSFATIPANTPYLEAVEKSLTYLSGIQNEDGGFPSDQGRPSSMVTTAWVIMALRAAGEDIDSVEWLKGGKSPVDFLNSGTGNMEATTDFARLLLALSAADCGPVFQGINIKEKIISFQQPNGQFAQTNEEGMINAHIWSIIALASAGNDIPNKNKAAEWLMENQNQDGGFGWVVGELSDPDDTGVAITALVLLGGNPQSSPAIQKALSYLKTQQDEGGGFRWTGQKSNAATDSWVIQGLLAAGADPASQWQVKGGNPFTHLLSLQNDDGSFNWTRELKSSPVLMTAYAIMALTHNPLPVNIEFGGSQDGGESSPPVNSEPAGNESPEQIIILVVGSRQVTVNGQSKLLDTPPVILNNRTLVPLRFVGDCLGAECTWIPESSEVEITYDGKTFTLLARKTTGETAGAIIQEGRTLVPLRYISENLGATVTWSGKERRIEIEK